MTVPNAIDAGQHKRGLTASRIAKPADDDAAKRTHQEADAEDCEGREQRSGRIAGRKEIVRDHACEEHVDAEVVPFEHVANGSGEYCFT
jgi:hypothetical protein